ncbi:MAG: radical SAM peptide maturase [Bacteroidota bacterium]
MKKPVSFSTSSGHSFLYSPFRNKILLCHPAIIHLYELDIAGVDLKQYIDLIKTGQQSIHLKEYKLTSDELLYQWKKYRFLKRKRFFKIPKPINLEGRLASSHIAGNLTGIQQVIFETTEECNLSCTYCTYSKFYINKERGNRKFDPAAAKTALNHLLSLRDKKSDQLTVSFYGGEPLRNFSFIREIVDFLNTSYGNDFSFKYTMSSNGLLLSKYAKFLAAHNFAVSVSLDGDETGNSFRLLPNNRSSHELVTKNLDYIKNHYPGYFDRCISFLTVLHKRNNFSAVQDYFRERYGKTTLTSFISTSNIPDERKEEFSNTFLDGMHHDFRERTVREELFMAHPTVKELANAIEKYSGIVFKNHFQVISRINGDEGTRAFVPTATCSPFSLRVFIAADGTVLPCEHIGRNFEIGHLGNNELKINHKSIAGWYNGYYDKIRSLCNSCFLADNCKECVFNTGIETEKPVCDYFMDEQKFKLLLGNAFNLIENEFPLYQRLLKEAFHE